VKSRIYSMIALILSLSLFSACSNSGTTKDTSGKNGDFEGVVLRTIGGPDETGYWAKVNKEFEEQTGIKIERDTVPYGQDTQKLINSFLAGGSSYDIFVTDVIDVPQYVAAGWVEPIDQWITEEMKEDLLPFAKSAVIYEDKWYGLPYASEWKSFVYNKEMLQKGGFSEPPKTWEEFIEVSQSLQEKGIVKYASSWSWLQGEALICDYTAIAASMGSTLFDADANPTFNDESGVKALQLMVDMIHKYKIIDPASLTFSEGPVGDAMAAGDIAFELQWGIPTVELNNEEQSKVVGQIEASLMPYEVKPATISGPMAFSISSGSKNKEASWKYIEYVAGPEGSKRATLENGMFPGWKSIYEDPEVKEKVPALQDIIDQGENAVNRPAVPWYNEWSSMMQVELQNALTQKKTPQQALEDATQKTLKIISEN